MRKNFISLCLIYNEIAGSSQDIHHWRKYSGLANWRNFRGCIIESTVDFCQLAKLQEMYWRKYSGFLPTGETPRDVLAKVLLAKAYWRNSGTPKVRAIFSTTDQTKTSQMIYSLNSDYPVMRFVESIDMLCFNIAIY